MLGTPSLGRLALGCLALGCLAVGDLFLGTLARLLDQDARRLRQVERDPCRATHSDIEMLVRAHAVAEKRVWAVMDRLLDADLDADVVWSWTMEHDGAELADLCASRLTDREVGDLIAQCAGARVTAAA